MPEFARPSSLPVKLALPEGAILMWQVTLPSDGALEIVKGCHSKLEISGTLM